MAPASRPEEPHLLDPLSLYLREAESAPRLTATEERDLAGRMRRGDQTRAEMLENVRFVLEQHVANRRVRRVLASLRQNLTPAVLEGASRAGVVLGPQDMGESEVLRAAVAIAQRKVELRNRQSIDVQTQDTLAALLHIARVTEAHLVPWLVPSPHPGSNARIWRRADARPRTASRPGKLCGTRTCCWWSALLSAANSGGVICLFRIASRKATLD